MIFRHVAARASAAGALGLLLFSPARIIQAASPGWPQWGGGPQHDGSSSATGQPLAAILADVIYDPFVSAETAEGAGQLDVHYAAPLVDADGSVYIEVKSGTYRGCDPPGSGQPAPCGSASWNLETWGVQKLQWRRGVLAPSWTFQSDWKPEPDTGGALLGWEPVFHPVLAGGRLFVPGAGGTVFEVDAGTGQAVSRINPFASLDLSIYVAGGLAADNSGNVYYNAIRLNPVNPWTDDALGAWLVRVNGSGQSATVAFSSLTSSAPSAGDPCETDFGTAFPWPPSPSAVAPTSPCGSQRPGINVIPAIAPDGTIYSVSRAHFNTRYGYLVAVRPDLTPLWSATLRGFLDDGCDVLLPPSGTPGGCRAGAAPGVDPATNNRPAGRVWDLSTSSPVVLPDGAILYGAQSTYNYFRGHLFKFSASGQPLAAYDFGWDSTPAVFRQSSSYSILIKDNHYDVGSYCFDSTFCPPETGRYDVTSLDPGLEVHWHFTNNDGFEWCVNQPAVDARGVVYANSEDGFLYALDASGRLLEKIFLNLAIGAAYTPVSIGPEGLIYSQNNGHLFAIGNPARPTLPPPPGGTVRQVRSR